MKVEVKKIEKSKRQLSIEVDGDTVRKKFDEVYNAISKEAKIAGFRAGKAPRDILEKNYGQVAHQEVLKSLVPQTYNKAIDEQNLEVIDLPQISEVKLDQNALSFVAVVELKPQIEINNYKGIPLKYQDIEVTPEQVKAKLDSLKESRKMDVIDDSFAKGLGYPTVVHLEKSINTQIYLQKDNEQRLKLEQNIIDHLTKTDFNLPSKLVERQLKDMVAQAKLDLALKGVTEDKIQEQESKISDQLKPQAEQRVRVYLLLEAIAKQENIALDEHMPSRTLEFLLREAAWENS